MSEPTPPEAKPAPAGGVSKVTLIAGIVGAAAISGGATFALAPKAAPPAAAEKAKPVHKESAGEAGSEAGAAAEEEPEEASEAEGETHVVTLPSFLVNLGEDTSDMHYLKVTIALETPGEEAAKQFEGKSARVRNNILMYLSSLKVEDIQGADKRKAILARVRTEVRHVVSSKLVRGIYMTEFVVQ